jgi:hypothetical protein
MGHAERASKSLCRTVEQEAHKMRREIFSEAISFIRRRDRKRKGEWSTRRARNQCQDGKAGTKERAPALLMYAEQRV